MNKSMVPGSTLDLSEKNNISLAESFLSAQIVVLLDNSGSMGANDGPMGQTRRKAAEIQLVGLQKKFPGQIALICFADHSVYSPGGIIVPCGGSTDMKGVLEFAKMADDCGLKIIIISDGFPNDPSRTLEIARTYQTKIDAIYIGPETDSSGRDFLEQLVSVTGGKFIKSDEVGQLEDGVETLLLGG